MNRLNFLEIGLCLGVILSAAGCGRAVPAVSAQDSDTGPHAAAVEPDMDANNLKVDHPEQFPAATAGVYAAAPELNVTGVVGPDVSRQVPVPSLASGKVVEIDARLGDKVTKGQLLLKVRSQDISQAFSYYRQAVADETLAKAQLDRAKELLEKGAIAKVKIETKIEFDDSCSSTSTLVQVITQDRPRLLHRIASCFSDQECNIEIALIDTEGQMAIDAFYLTSGGKKLTSEHQKKVEKALVDELKSLELGG